MEDLAASKHAQSLQGALFQVALAGATVNDMVDNLPLELQEAAVVEYRARIDRLLSWGAEI